MANKKQFVTLTIAILLLVAASYALFPAGNPPEGTVDNIIVIKSKHRMLLMQKGAVLRSYTVSVGRGAVGPKTRAGDHRTPEGDYIVDWRNPKSRFHLSLHLSYPNSDDVRRARQSGVAPGGDIMIHGLQNGLGWIGRYHRWIDWTDGCIAVTNSEMDQVWRVVSDGTPIEIRP